MNLLPTNVNSQPPFSPLVLLQLPPSKANLEAFSGIICFCALDSKYSNFLPGSAAETLVSRELCCPRRTRLRCV